MFFKLFLTFFFFQLSTFTDAAPTVYSAGSPAVADAMWSKPIITYSIKNPSKQHLSPAFQYAFDQWSTVIPNKFQQISNLSADIVIYFSPRLPTNTLSKTAITGDFMTFNDHENWALYYPGNQIIPVVKDITATAMREIGNLLVMGNVRDNNSTPVSWENYYVTPNYSLNGTYILPRIMRR